MNNKEFIAALAERTNLPSRDVSALVTALETEISAALEEEKTISITGFGNFEVKKKLERVMMNPTTGLRMLVPPKLVLAFKPNQALKGKVKNGREE